MPIAPLSEWLLLAVLITAIGFVLFFKLRKYLVFNSPLLSSALFTVKVCAGILLLYIYSDYHSDRSTADVYKYYDDASAINQNTENNRKMLFLLTFGLISDDEVNPEYLRNTRNWLRKDESWIRFSKTKDFNFFQSNRFITRIHLVLWPLTKGKILLHVLFFAFISYAGAVYLLRILELNIESKLHKIAISVIFLLPTTLLWCSGMLKDTLVLFALQFLLFQWFKGKGPYATVGIVFSVLLILMVKYYLIPPLFFVFFIHRLTKIGFTFLKAAFTATLVLVVVVMIGKAIGVPFDVVQVLVDKRQEALKIAVMGDAKEYVFYNFSTVQSFVSDVFKAIVNGLLYPFWPFSIKNKMGVLFWLESILLWISTFIFLFNRIKSKHKPETALLIVVLFSVLAGFIIAFTTPVAGGLLRYKSAYWSVLFAFAWFAWKKQTTLLPSSATSSTST